MAELRIGTCSWKYPSWQGLVYSRTSGVDYLREYATKYDTVEVDQWFWSLFDAAEPKLPNPADAAAYRRDVPETFRFSIKAPDSLTLTHHRQKDKSESLVANPSFLSVDLFNRFMEDIAALHDVLGPVMFQFEYLNRQKMAGQTDFLRVMRPFFKSLPAGVTYGLEIRNPNYLNESLFHFMEDMHLAPVLLQGYYMPSIIPLYHHFREIISRQETVVIRLHGPDRQGMEEMAGMRWDRLVVSRDPELAEIALIAKDLLTAGAKVYVNVNNHYEGSAPLTIARLRKQLGPAAASPQQGRLPL